MPVCVQASGSSSLEDSFDHDVSRQGSVHAGEGFPHASEEAENTGGFTFLLPVSQCAHCPFVAFQGRPGRAPRPRAASRPPSLATAVPDRNPSLTPCPISLPPPIIITPSSDSAPSWIWGLAGQLSPFLLDLQDTSFFVYFNMVL